MGLMTSSAELNDRDSNSQNKNIVENSAELALALGVGVKAAKVINNNPEYLELYNKLPGTYYLNNQIEARKLQGITEVTIAAQETQNMGRAILSQAMALEETSPLHILRTLQLTNLMQPFIPLNETNTPLHIASRSVQSQQFFYEKLLENAAVEDANKKKRLLTARDLREGFFFHDNKLYGATVEGTINKSDVILDNARLIMANVKNGQVISSNHILQKYSDIIGAKINRSAAKLDPLMVIGASSNLDFSQKWARSYARFAMEIGYKTLDNPLGGFEELLRGFGADHLGIFDTKMWESLKSISNIQLGTNGIYNLSTRESLKIMSKNVAIKGAKMFIGYQALDSIMRTVSLPGSEFHNGLASGIASTYVDARIKFAQVWSDHFQGYKQAQEQAAPNSTSLVTLLGFPAAGALIGAQYSYFNRLKVTATKGIDTAAARFTHETESKLLARIGIKEMLTPMKKNALIGAMIGGALTLPFLPGALIGKSSDQLKDEYSGRVEVANRANRGWLFGGNSINGEHIKYFQQSWFARMRSNATDKVRYGDEATKRRLSPFLHPFGYLRNPYKFEEMHQKDMPYPVWGMDVSYGGFLGKVFEKTLGRVIKPDVVNPRFLDYVKEGVNPNGGFKSRLVHYAESLYSQATNTIVSPTPIYNSVPDQRAPNTYTIARQENSKDQQLINAGLMVRRPSPKYTPASEGVKNIYSNLADFAGIKGWTSNIIIEKIGFTPGASTPQLARSGEATSFSRDIKDANLGDLMGIGEFQRKLIPTSSASLYDRVNPLQNTMPSWLPHDASKFYIDFSKGNPYAAVENGEQRLPGKGLEALNPELKGLDPKRYPLVFQYKVLSDVAKGSQEQIAARKQLIDLYKHGKLSNREIDIFTRTLDQEVQKDQKKQFYEYANTMQKSNMGLIGKVQNSIWETIAHAESPLEMLTPLRPMSKFVHQRTAIEDYQATQLGGPDTAIWTNPYGHFIKPAINKTVGMLPGIHKPKEASSRDNINEYFDKLNYIKNRRSGNIVAAGKTVIASSYSGLNTEERVLQFKAALTDNQRDYFDSFSKQADPKKRAKILAMLPEDIGRGYQQIWHNVDIATKAKKNHVSVEKALAEDYHKQTVALESSFGYKAKLSKSEEVRAEQNVQNNRDAFVESPISHSQRVKYEKDSMKRQKMADIESTGFVNQRTGMPSSHFSGWDPRIDMNDIKIRTLSIGGEDLKKFGFWKRDEERAGRLTVVQQEDEVTHQISGIKRQMQNQHRMKNEIAKSMFSNGFKVSKVDISDSGRGSVIINNKGQ